MCLEPIKRQLAQAWERFRERKETKKSTCSNYARVAFFELYFGNRAYGSQNWAWKNAHSCTG